MIMDLSLPIKCSNLIQFAIFSAPFHSFNFILDLDLIRSWDGSSNVSLTLILLEHEPKCCLEELFCTFQSSPASPPVSHFVVDLLPVEVNLGSACSSTYLNVPRSEAALFEQCLISEIGLAAYQERGC